MEEQGAGKSAAETETPPRAPVGARKLAPAAKAAAETAPVVETAAGAAGRWFRGLTSGGNEGEIGGDRSSGSLFSGGTEAARGRAAGAGPQVESESTSPVSEGGGGGVGGRESSVLLREDGQPDWSVLTDRVGGLAHQTAGFELMCFVDNSETDTQVRGDSGSWSEAGRVRGGGSWMLKSGAPLPAIETGDVACCPMVSVGR